MGGGKGSTTTRSDIPPELRPLYQEGGQRILDLQRHMPLSDFSSPSGQAFQTAPRQGQFASAQAEAYGARGLTGPVASRGALDAESFRTAEGIQTAQQAAQRAGRVPGQFAQLRPLADQRVGLQGLERSATRRAADVQNRVGEVPGTFGEVRAQADPRLAELTSHADRRITGEELMDSRSYQAAQNAFEAAILPTIQNSAALSGLGRSTGLQQSIAAGQAQYLLPVIQEELAREERSLERGLGARQFSTQFAADLGLQEAMAQERGLDRFGQAGMFAAGLESDIGGRMGQRAENRIGRQLDATLQHGLAGERGIERNQVASQFLANQQQAAGQQQLQRQLEGLYADERTRGMQYQGQQDLVGNLMNIGQSEQDYQQGIHDRQTQDYLRRQALSESALYGPFGQIAPSSIGQQASSSKK